MLAHVDTKAAYIRTSARHYGCVRAAWVISHARTGPTAPFEYLSESRRVATTIEGEYPDWGEKKKKKKRVYVPRKTGRVRRMRLDKPFKRGWKGAHECPWWSCSSNVPACGPAVTLRLTKRTSFSTMSRSPSVSSMVMETIGTAVNNAQIENRLDIPGQQRDREYHVL